jgi:hypothetical protein
MLHELKRKYTRKSAELQELIIEVYDVSWLACFWEFC